MGTTLGSIHILTKDLPDKLMHSIGTGAAYRLSEEWVTILDQSFREQWLEPIAQRISKSVDKPVLSFSLFDDDLIELIFAKQGRSVASYRMTYGEPDTTRGLRSFVGFMKQHTDDAKRLRRIFDCSDIDRKIAMLEEFFGIALRLDEEMLKDATHSFVITRGSMLYEEYSQEQKKIEKIRNRTKANLVYENDAKTVDDRSHSTWLSCYRNLLSIYDSHNAQPMVLENDTMFPLFESDELRFDCFNPISIFASATRVVVQTNSCYLYMRDGSLDDIISLPNGYNRILCILDEDSLLCETTYPFEERGIARVGFDGEVRWKTTFDIDCIYIGPMVFKDHIYLGSRDISCGGTIFKIDFLGNILSKTFVPQIRNSSKFIFLENRLFYLGELPGKQVELLEFDSFLHLIRTIHMPDSYPLSSFYFLDQHERRLILDTFERTLLTIDLDTFICSTADKGTDFFILESDDQGFLYALQGDSTVLILDADVHIISRHRLKGNVCSLYKTETGMHALTVTGDLIGWGFPEDCTTRIYRFDFIVPNR
jgi:hypothetical protein